MGYFSNGSEGERYESEFCARCIHGDDKDDPDTGAPKCCPVWFVHLCFNYNQHKNEPLKQALEQLIPRAGVHNAQCTMFIERADARLSLDIQQVAAIKGRIAILEAQRGEIKLAIDDESWPLGTRKGYLDRDRAVATQVRLLKWVLGEVTLP